MSIQIFPRAGRVNRARQHRAEQRIDEHIRLDRVRALLYERQLEAARREVDRLRHDFRQNTPSIIDCTCDPEGDAA